MKELFMYRIQQAEKPSKKEKYIRKVMMWIVLDIVFLALAVSLYNEALHTSYTIEITRSDVREDEGHNRTVGFTPETIPQTDGMGVHEEGEADTQPLLTIKKVAKEEGVDWKVIYAICKKETGCNPNIDCSKQGGHCDNGNSFGAYQINRPAHPTLAVRDMEDFEWSTRWTAQRLKAKSEKWGIDMAVMLHNGNPRLPQVKAYLADVNRIIASL